MIAVRVPTVQAARMLRAEGLVWRYCLSDPAPGVVWLTRPQAREALERYGCSPLEARVLVDAAQARAIAEAVAS